MKGPLSGIKIGVLVADGFEQVEMVEPRNALEEAGAGTDLISPNRDTVRGWNFKDWGDEFKVDVTLDEALPADYDGLVLPGGSLSPDKLRKDPRAVQFVREFFETGKPVAAICHGPWTLVEAGVLRGRRVTSYESIQTDLKNAGAQWVDEPVVVDDGLVSSRNPDDIPAFNQKMIETFQQYCPLPAGVAESRVPD